MADRLEGEVEEKGNIPEWQAKFRKGKCVMDSIYTINYIIGRELQIGKEMVAMMVDLKAAFDSVDKEVLGRRLEEGGISKRIRERIRKIYRETRVCDKYRREKEEEFVDEKVCETGMSTESDIV